MILEAMKAMEELRQRLETLTAGSGVHDSELRQLPEFSEPHS
jgi:hypothetical protein